MPSVVCENLAGVNLSFKFAGNLLQVWRQLWALVDEQNLFEFRNSR